MILVLEIAAGIVLGGMILHWSFSPEKVAVRKDRRMAKEFGKMVDEAAELQKAMDKK